MGWTATAETTTGDLKRYGIEYAIEELWKVITTQHEIEKHPYQAASS